MVRSLRCAWALLFLSGCFDPPDVIEGGSTTGTGTSDASQGVTSATMGTVGSTTATTDATMSSGTESTAGSTTDGPAAQSCLVAHLGGGPQSTTLASFLIAPDGTISLVEERDYPGDHRPVSGYDAFEFALSRCHQDLLVANHDSENVLRVPISDDGGLLGPVQQFGVEDLEIVACDEEDNLVFTMGETGSMVTLRSHAIELGGRLVEIDSQTVDFVHPIARLRAAFVTDLDRIIINGAPDGDENPNPLTTATYTPAGTLTFPTPIDVLYTRRPTRVRLLPDTDTVFLTGVTNDEGQQGLLRIGVGESLTFDNNETFYFEGNAPWSGTGDMFLLPGGLALFADTGPNDNQILVATVDGPSFQEVSTVERGGDYGFFRRAYDDMLILASQDSLITMTEPDGAGIFDVMDEKTISTLIVADVDPVWFQDAEVVPCTR